MRMVPSEMRNGVLRRGRQCTGMPSRSLAAAGLIAPELWLSSVARSIKIFHFRHINESNLLLRNSCPRKKDRNLRQC